MAQFKVSVDSQEFVVEANDETDAIALVRSENKIDERCNPVVTRVEASDASTDASTESSPETTDDASGQGEEGQPGENDHGSEQGQV